MDNPSPGAYDEVVKKIEILLREAVGRLGNQHPEVLKILRHYITVLRQCGRVEQADKMEVRADALQKLIATATAEKRNPQGSNTSSETPSEAPGEKPNEAPGETLQAEITQSSRADTNIFLYDSQGKHIAVACTDELFSPDGKVIGHYLEDFDVFLDCNGWYLGQIVDTNRLTKDLAWMHRHLNFGARGNTGSRPGWGRSRDIERTVFGKGFADVELSN